MPTTLPSRTRIVRPIGGQYKFDPAEETPLEYSPDLVNCYVNAGMLCKRPGYSQFPSGHASLGGRIVGLYSTQDEEDNTFLHAVTPAAVFRWNASTNVWDALTGAALSGSSNLWWFETSQNCVVGSNGADPVQSIPLTGATWAALDAGAVPSRSGTRFADRLYLGYTVEGGNTRPYRIRRSVAGDHTDWSGLGSGFSDLTEFPYHVRNIRKLGARLAAYTEQSIMLGTRTGIVAAPARFDISAADVGLYSAYTLVGWKDEHFFLGNDDFYAYNAVQPQELSLPVRDTLFNTLNPAALLRNFAVPKMDTKEYVAFLCTGSGTSPDTAWVYNKQRRIWYPWTVAGPVCGCTHRLDTTQSIDSLIGTIDEQNWEFDTRDLLSQFPVLLTGHTDGKVYQWSAQYKSDAGTAIDCRWTSKDFTARDVDPEFGNNKVILKHIGVSYQDQGAAFDLSFSYSVDGGASWTSADVESFASAGGTTRIIDKLVTHQITGNRVRFKIEQNSATQSFAILSFHVHLEVDSSQIYT